MEGNATNMVMWVFSGLFLIVSVLLLLRRKRRGKILPGPVGYPVVGSLYDVIPSKILTNFARDMKIYGGIFELYVLSTRLVVISDPAIFREVMMKQPKILRRNQSMDYATDSLNISGGLLFLYGHGWSRTRRLLSPAFSRQNVITMIPTVFSEVADIVKKFKNRAKNSEVIEFNMEMQFYTCRVIAKVAFGEDDNAINKYFCTSQFPRDLEASFRFQTVSNTYHLPRWTWKYSPYYKYEVKARDGNKRISEACEKVVNKRRSIIFAQTTSGSTASASDSEVSDKDEVSPLPSTNQTSPRSSSLIDLLLRQANGDKDGLTDQEILANVKVFFGAGTETTSVSISWAIFYLSENPTLVEELRREHLEVFQGEDSFEALCEEGNMEKMLNSYSCLEIARAIFKEAIRIRSPVPLHPLCMQDPSDPPIQLSDGTVIGGNDVIMAYIEGSLISEKNFEDPLSFHPKRWLTKDKECLAQMNNAFLGFGTGPRICPGQDLAFMEGAIMLTALYHYFDMELACNPSEVNRLFNFTSCPSKMPIRVTSRR